MNRNFTSILASILVCLVYGILTACGGSAGAPPPLPTLAITATSGSGQKANVGEAFTNMLVATVASNGAAASGVTVTFTPVPGSAGQSCTPSATTATTAPDGTASITCTANSTPGAYSVTAAATGATATASFTEGNTAPRVFVFYVNGLENSASEGPVYYGVAGAVGFDLSGNVLGGEQDYNDGQNGFTTPVDTITATGSSMTVNPTTGTGTLVLDVSASNPNVGVNGIEKFAVQFINASHALITQFDGSATSSGSLDLQTATSAVDGNFAFTLSGIDIAGFPFAYGGVFSNTSGSIHGTYDENDAGTAIVGNTLTATDNGVGADVYGRGSITGFTDPNHSNEPISLVYYIVGPEVLRIIDVDADDTMAGSAYGQGSATSFDSTVLSKDVFGILDNTEDAIFAAAGQLVATGTAVGTFNATFTGEGDDDEGGTVMATGTPGGVAGHYSFSNTVLGYGSMKDITGLGSIHTLGLYATDPKLNLLDPNNTTAANLGAALVLDLDDFAQGTGVVIPQGTVASDGSDLDHSYGFGAQAYVDNGSFPSGNPGWEYDFVGQGTFSSLAFATGSPSTLVDLSDPFASFVSGKPGEYTAVPITGTAAAPDAAGRYAFHSATPFAVGPVGAAGPTLDFTVVLYEAGPGLVFFIEEDTSSEWLGTFQEMSAGPLNAMHVKRGPLIKNQAKPKR
ncbi:MAG TPA: hypothetical protein VKV39_15155 [Candidatus Sulfotelmatobacter sp.]|nr:hypothetical protein [Candidatus Sulfotelmatobacter sp.]